MDNTNIIKYKIPTAFAYVESICIDSFNTPPNTEDSKNNISITRRSNAST